jgi:Flp pilus assembly secretin CpaC
MPARHIRLLPQGALLPLFWLSLFAPTAQAAETETIQLSPGFARLIKLNQVIGTVIIGSPDVVDATLQGDKAVLLTAKRVTGSAATNVIVFNQQGTEIFNATIAVGSQDSGKVEIRSSRILGISLLTDLRARRG